MRNNNRRGKSKFKRILKRYICVLVVISIIFLIYVMNTLYQYEDSFTDNYMEEFCIEITRAAKSGKLNKYCDFSNEKYNDLERNKENTQKSVEEVIKNSNITCKLDKNNKSTQETTYGLYANDSKIMDVTLNVKKQNKRLGMFSYPTWQVKECKLNSDRGIFYYDIMVPSNYTVRVNSSKLSKNYISDSKTNDDYKVFSKYMDLPKMVNYKLDNFVSQPEIVIEDETGKKLEYEIKNHRLELSSLFRTSDTYDEAKHYLEKEIDVLDIAKKWSLFLTDDLKGERHGFNELNQYLVKGTNIYNMAYSWATSIDITFTSKHTLKDPTFTNTKISNFEMYGKKAFSCIVYLEKNMKLANGSDKVDRMHEKLYFVYYDDTNDGENNPHWKMVDMKAITKK